MLDCKNPACHEIAWDFKGSPFLLCDACTAHFNDVRQGLKGAGIAYDDTKTFARGLDYYTRTVFEVRAKGLGAQDAVAAGGRYDHLVEELGGPSVGAFGFAAGIERVLMAASGDVKPADAAASRRGVYLAIAQPDLTGEGFRLIQTLRSRGVPATMDYDSKSLKAQLREADKSGCQFVAVLGAKELQEQTITIKDLGQGSQRTVRLASFAEEIAGPAKASCHSS